MWTSINVCSLGRHCGQGERTAQHNGSRRISNGRLRRGFTLIELLVVVAIISLLVTILMPILNEAKRLARGVVCASTLRNAGMALRLYTEENDSILPLFMSESVEDEPVYWHLHTVAPYLAFEYRPLEPEKPLRGRLSRAHECPADQDLFNTGGNQMALEPSYGYNTLMGVGGDHEKYVAGEYEYWSIDDVQRPAEKIGVADSQHQLEDLGRAFIVSRNPLGRGLVAPRHNETYNIAWMDGHVASLNIHPELLIDFDNRRLWLPDMDD